EGEPVQPPIAVVPPPAAQPPKPAAKPPLPPPDPSRIRAEAKPPAPVAPPPPAPVPEPPPSRPIVSEGPVITKTEEKEIVVPRKGRPKMIALTLLDGTTINIPGPAKKRRS